MADLLNLDMEPKVRITVVEVVRGGGQAHAPGGKGRETIGLAVQEVVDVLGCRFQRDWKGTQWSKRHSAQGWVVVGATLIFIARTAFL